MPAKPSIELYQLIQGMTDQEKRFCRKQLKQGKKDRRLDFELFEAMEKQKVYDEGELIRKNSDKTFVNQLSSAKTHLMDRLLDILLLFREKQGQEVGLFVRKQICQAKLAREMGLIQKEERLLKKAVEIAQLHQLPEEEIEIIDLMRVRLRHEFPKNTAQRLVLLQARKTYLFGQIQKREKLLNISDQLHLQVRKNFTQENEKASLQIPEPYSFPAPDSFDLIENNYQYHYCCGNYHQFKKNHTEKHHHFRAMVEVLESNPEVLRRNRHRYRLALSNALMVGLEAGDYAHFDEDLNKIKEIPLRSEADHVEFFQNVEMVELLSHIRKDEFQEAKALIGRIQRGLDEYEHLMTKSRYLSFLYNLAGCYLVLRMPDNARQYIYQINKRSRWQSRRDIIEFAPVFELMVNFLTHEPNEIYAQARNLRRKHINGMDGITKVLLDAILKLSNCSDDHRSKILTQLKQDLKPFAGSLGFGEALEWMEQLNLP